MSQPSPFFNDPRVSDTRVVNTDITKVAAPTGREISFRTLENWYSTLNVLSSEVKSSFVGDEIERIRDEIYSNLRG